MTEAQSTESLSMGESLSTTQSLPTIQTPPQLSHSTLSHLANDKVATTCAVECRISSIGRGRCVVRDGNRYLECHNIPSHLHLDDGWYYIEGAIDHSTELPIIICNSIAKVPPPEPLPTLEPLPWADDEDRCENCGSATHEGDDCPLEEDPRSLRCDECDAVGHLSNTCPKLLSPSGKRGKFNLPEIDSEEAWDASVALITGENSVVSILRRAWAEAGWY